MDTEFFSVVSNPESQLKGLLKGIEKIQKKEIPSAVSSEFDKLEKSYKADSGQGPYRHVEYQRQILKKENGKESTRYYMIGERSIPPLPGVKLYPQPIISVVLFENDKVIDIHTQQGDIDIQK